MWFFLSLFSAIFTALNDVISKYYFSTYSAYEMALIRLLYAFPLLFTYLIIMDTPSLDPIFWISVFLALPLEVAAFLTYMEAIRSAPLSLCIPFLSFTPAFMIFTGNLILGEKVSSFGIIGILLIVIGSYILNISDIKREIMGPFRSIFRIKGTRLMLLTAAIYSITATLGKLAINHSNPQFFATFYFTVLSIIFFSIWPFRRNAKIDIIIKRPFASVLSGVVTSAMIFSHVFAIKLIEAACMISVKRSSLLFGVLFGAIFFKEKEIGKRFIGASIMMSGVIIIGVMR